MRYSREDVCGEPWNELAQALWELANEGRLVPVRDEHGEIMRRPNPRTGRPEIAWRAVLHETGDTGNKEN